MDKALDLGFSGLGFGTPSPKVFLRETPFYFVVSKKSTVLVLLFDFFLPLRQ